MGRSAGTIALALTLFASADAISLSIEPALKDKTSDKKFFGPPFPADYAEDTRPVVQKHILDKLKGPEQPYPALQSKKDYDSDFVKDENSDTGAWQAQFEYDALRKKLAQAEADEKNAQGKADKEGGDTAGAQRDADEAAKKAADAQKELDGATADQDSAAKTADDFDGPPSAEKLEELKKAVAQAEEKFAKEKTDFEKCQKQLDDAKANLEALKKQQADMEAELAKATQLWVEQKTTKLNIQKTKADAAAKAHQEKLSAAHEKLADAQKAKAAVDKTLAKEKAEHEAALQSLHKEQAEMKQAKSDLEATAAKLQKLRGYKPAEVPAKSGAKMASAVLSMVAILATQNL